MAADPGETKNLLSGTLTAEQRTHYVYLCGELSALTGIAGGCAPSVPVQAPEETIQTDWAYPNPFTSNLYLRGNTGAAQVELYDAVGQLLYSGQALEKQDFSALASGVYFLKRGGRVAKVVKW